MPHISIWSRAHRLVLACLWVAAGAVQAAPTSAEDYARWPEFGAFTVSPSNTHAAFLAAGKGGRMSLVVIDLADPAKRRLIAAHDDLDVTQARWVNDQRLVYWARGAYSATYSTYWDTYAIDRDGSGHRALTTDKPLVESSFTIALRKKELPPGWEVSRPVGDGSDDVYLVRYRDSLNLGYRAQDIARVDTRTLSMRRLGEGQPDGTSRWLFDAKGDLRVVTALVKDRRQLWWKPADDAAWQKVEETSLYTGQGITPLALEGDGTLIVSASVGRDTAALHTYSLARKQLDPEPLVAVEGFDVEGGVVFDRRAQRVVGVHVEAQRGASVWFEDNLAKAQAVVDKALPAGRHNQLLCGHCASAQRFVVLSVGDRQSGEYHVYDAASGKLTWLGQRRAWIDEAKQGRRSFHRVAARDGLSLPVVVTHPAGAADDQPLPTVLLVHGGPWVRGTDTGWSAEPQFLASRGYRVLEVDFRGSSGLGWKHFRAGWGQFGLAMQDDLEDALLWAVKGKLSDPDKVCIYGASYGGYAALMGPVRHAGRYRCAVSHAGVTDLALMFSWNWTDIPSAGRNFGWGALVGDPERDAEKLRQNSPLHRVADIKVPVLVVQGRYDRRVAPVHADRFVSAARSAGVDVKRIDYDAGHGWYDAETHARFLGELETFLARHLKAAAPN